MLIDIKKLVGALYIDHPDSPDCKYDIETIDNYKFIWKKIFKIKKAEERAALHQLLKADYALWLNLWLERGERIFFYKTIKFIQRQSKSYGMPEIPDRFLNKSVAPALFYLKMKNDLICGIRGNNLNYKNDPYGSIYGMIMEYIFRSDYQYYFESMLNSAGLSEFLISSACTKPSLIKYFVNELSKKENQRKFHQRSVEIFLERITSQTIADEYFDNVNKDKKTNVTDEEIQENINYYFAGIIIGSYPQELWKEYLGLLFADREIDLLHPYIFNNILKKLYPDDNKMFNGSIFNKIKIAFNKIKNNVFPIKNKTEITSKITINKIKFLNDEYLEKIVRDNIGDICPVLWLHHAPERHLKNLNKYPINNQTKMALIYQTLLNREQNFSLSGKEMLSTYLSIDNFDFLKNKSARILRREDKYANPISKQLFSEGGQAVLLNEFEKKFLDRLYRFFYYCVRHENSYTELIDPIMEHNINHKKYDEIYFYFSLFDTKSTEEFSGWLNKWVERLMIHKSIPQNLWDQKNTRVGKI